MSTSAIATARRAAASRATLAAGRRRCRRGDRDARVRSAPRAGRNGTVERPGRGELPVAEPTERAHAVGWHATDREARERLRDQPAGGVRQQRRLPGDDAGSGHPRQLQRAVLRRERSLLCERIERGHGGQRRVGDGGRTCVHRQRDDGRLQGDGELRLRVGLLLPDERRSGGLGRLPRRSLAAYALTGLAGRASKLTVGVGARQSTPTGTRFPIRLAVTVTDAEKDPLPGVPVTFVAPSRGPSGRFTVRSGGAHRPASQRSARTLRA